LISSWDSLHGPGVYSILPKLIKITFTVIRHVGSIIVLLIVILHSANTNTNVRRDDIFKSPIAWFNTYVRHQNMYIDSLEHSTTRNYKYIPNDPRTMFELNS